MQPISGRTWLEWIRLSRIFRAPFANLSLEIVKKWVDTISYLVFRGSSANLSPTCTFLERYLSRRHLKSMPVDLDYIKPFMGFCTTLIYPRQPGGPFFPIAYWCIGDGWCNIHLSTLGGWAPRTDGYVVHNHGDPKSPKDRVVGPL